MHLHVGFILQVGMVGNSGISYEALLGRVHCVVKAFLWGGGGIKARLFWGMSTRYIYIMVQNASFESDLSFFSERG